MDPIIDTLMASEEPAVRYKTLVKILGADPDSPEARRVEEEVAKSPRVATMIESTAGLRAYDKWLGSHWVLAILGDIGAPRRDPRLMPLRDKAYNAWLHPAHTREQVRNTKAASYGQAGVPIIDGRARRCGSQEGNTLFATLALDIADERADQLAANLIRWQWPDGGWNCDRNPSASVSSFHETFIPLRALALHGRLRKNAESAAAADRATEPFLKRRLFRRLKDGEVMHPAFLKPAYPCYWHYDFLAGPQGNGRSGKDLGPTLPGGA